MFSFDTPHFVYRFVKGETDYQLGITPYSYFEFGICIQGFFSLSAGPEFDILGENIFIEITSG